MSLLLVLACEYAAFTVLLPLEPLTWVLSLIFDKLQWFCWLLAVTACTLLGIFWSGYETETPPRSAEAPGTAACADVDLVSLKVAPSPVASGCAASVRLRPATKTDSRQPTLDGIAPVGLSMLAAPTAPSSSSTGPAGPASAGWTPARRNLVVRKAFHAVALALFAPPVLLGGAGGLAFMQVASAGALHIALLLELARAARAPPAALCRVVDAAMRPFVDERDAGPLVLTHLYLIAGCGLPLWLAAPRAAAVAAAGVASGLGAGGAAAGGAVPWTAAWMLVLPLAGVIAAMGDAAAATCGIHASVNGHAVSWGALLRLRSPPRKTLQGTAGFAALAWLLSVVAAAVAGRYLELPLAAVLQPAALLGAAACAVVAALVETATVGVDNLLLPLVYWLLLDTALQRWQQDG